MSNEEKNLEVKECSCICQNKYFKLGLTIAISSFVGLYCAMNLFFALHRPPMPPCPCHLNQGFHRPVYEHQMKFDKDKGFKKDFKKEIKEQKEIDD